MGSRLGEALFQIKTSGNILKNWDIRMEDLTFSKVYVDQLSLGEKYLQFRQ